MEKSVYFSYSRVRYLNNGATNANMINRIACLYLFGLVAFFSMACNKSSDNFPKNPQNFSKEIFVNVASTATKPDGRSWATAFKNVQEAIESAYNGETIYVASGIYKMPKIDIYDKEDINILGGYKAGKANERNRTSEWTIFDGDKKNEPLINIMGKSRNITLDGIIFQNVSGATAVRIDGSKTGLIENISISNSKFLDNENQRFTAGLYLSRVTKLKIVDVDFTNNKSIDDCGALSIGKYNFNIRVEDSIFENNQSDQSGGALCLDAYAAPESVLTIFGVEFRNNQSKLDNGGGAISATFNGNFLDILEKSFQPQLVFMGPLKHSNNTTRNNKASLILATFLGSPMSDEGAKRFIGLYNSGILWDPSVIYVNNK